MPVNGLDRTLAEGSPFRNQRIGLVCNQATVTAGYVHALDALLAKGVEVAAAFGPQHGIWGHTQDNMIEWEGYEDPRTGLPFYSLYGKHRKPVPGMLEGLDRLVIDLPDIGARYYTFMWTAMLCLEACSEAGIPVTILDRPNPIGGTQVEGTVLEPEFASFVGLKPLPMRHGLTLGELATYFKRAYYPKADLTVVQCQGWSREPVAEPWVMPSPNMPTPDTALVYPGACLLEGTTMSEGRGTTRPFELLGSPGLDAWEYADALNGKGLPGVFCRAATFLPTFQKHAGELCGGVQVHVTDSEAFQPVLTFVAVLQEARKRGAMDYIDPPYEYEEVLLPFDILAGNGWLREAVDNGWPLHEVAERFRVEVEAFAPERAQAMLYPS